MSQCTYSMLDDLLIDLVKSAKFENSENKDELNQFVDAWNAARNELTQNWKDAIEYRNQVERYKPQSIDCLMSEQRRIAVDHGWWNYNQNDGEILMLMVSELAEALEYIRHDNPPSDHIPDFSGVEEEMADVVIRVLGFCNLRGYRLAEAIKAKMAFNDARSYKHGGKKF